jgi:GAF domain-containing protein
MDAFTQEEQELLHVISENVAHLTETDQLEEATHILESLTNEEKVAVWSLLGSKVRTKLKQLITK